MWLGYSTQLFNQIPIWVLLWWYSVDKINIYFIGSKWRLSSHSAAWLCPVSWTVSLRKKKFACEEQHRLLPKIFQPALPDGALQISDLPSQPHNRISQLLVINTSLSHIYVCVCVCICFFSPTELWKTLKNFETCFPFTVLISIQGYVLCIYLYICHFS